MVRDRIREIPSQIMMEVQIYNIPEGLPIGKSIDKLKRPSQIMPEAQIYNISAQIYNIFEGLPIGKGTWYWLIRDRQTANYLRKLCLGPRYILFILKMVHRPPVSFEGGTPQIMSMVDLARRYH